MCWHQHSQGTSLWPLGTSKHLPLVKKDISTHCLLGKGSLEGQPLGVALHSGMQNPPWDTCNAYLFAKGKAALGPDRMEKILRSFLSKTRCVTAGTSWGAECFLYINLTREIMSSKFVFSGNKERILVRGTFMWKYTIIYSILCSCLQR